MCLYLQNTDVLLSLNASFYASYLMLMSLGSKDFQVKFPVSE